MTKNNIILLLLLVNCQEIFAQLRVSLATDVSLERSFKKDQQFWAIGQDVVVNWHFNPKNGAYAAVSYYSNGNFRNELSAVAKSPATAPQEIFFSNKAQLRLVQISLGLKHYFKGTSDAENGWNLYSMSGFGLIFGKATNSYSTVIDTSLYAAPLQPVNASGHFKRLTLELGLGWEVPLGGDIFFYAEGKIWIPTSDYPSKYLFVNNDAPLTGTLNGGLRILF